MKPFETVKLGSVAIISGGKRLPNGANFRIAPTAHPYIRARDIGQGKIHINEPVYLSDDIAKKLIRYTVNAGDICLTIVGANVGDIGAVPSELEGANLTENAVKIVTNGKADQSYLKYALLSDDALAQMKVLAGGSAQPKLGIYKVETIIISLPPLPLQRRIAKVLLSYDNLVENIQRRIEILGEIAASLYREWFVLFRFPGHAKVQLVKSSLGLIPEQWSVKQIGNVLTLEYGKALTREKRIEGPFPVFGSSGLIGYHNSSMVNGPGVLVGRAGNAGSVHWSNQSFFPVDSVFFVKPIDKSISAYLLYFMLKNAELEKLVSGSAVPGINRNAVYAKEVCVPDIGVQRSFDEFIRPVFDLIDCLDKRCNRLSQTRDLLLHKLLSGELDVSKLPEQPVEANA